MIERRFPLVQFHSLSGLGETDRFNFHVLRFERDNNKLASFVLDRRICIHELEDF